MRASASIMVDIDWGDLKLSCGQRACLQARLDTLAHIEGPSVALRRRGSGYEARLVAPASSSPAELRLAGEDLTSLIDRTIGLLTIMARERRSGRRSP